MNETEKHVYQRMLDRATFEFSDLHVNLHESAYRFADKTLQKLRKSGFAEYSRTGRKYTWRLTVEGEAHIKGLIAQAK